jgi:2-C-methyl-D-erythritol 4-phosphate cytidylyltransferase
MDKYALIVAGGIGSRMGIALPKQFILLNERPVLYHTIKPFFEAFPDIHVILVLPALHIEKGQEIIDAFFDKEKVTITSGGNTRFQSVKNGLSLIHSESIIFVHDGVRCLVSPSVIHRCFAQAIETGTAIPVITSTDSVRILTDKGNEAIDRKKVQLVQTPQTFHSKILLPAYQIDYKQSFTDDASVVEAFGLKVSLVAGDERNIKITTPADLLFAEGCLKNG